MPEPAGAGWQADDDAGTSGGQLVHGGREQVSNVTVVPALTLTASGAWATRIRVITLCTAVQEHCLQGRLARLEQERDKLRDRILMLQRLCESHTSVGPCSQARALLTPNAIRLGPGAPVT